MARLTKAEWDLIQVEFESGKNNSETARKYGITEAAIRKKAIANNWTKTVRDAIIKVVDSYKDIAQSTRKYEPEQKHKVNDIIKEELLYIGIMNDITSIVLKAHKNIAISTVNKLAKGEYQPHQCAAVFQMQGLNVPNLAKMVGITTIAPDVTPENVKMPNDVLEASRAYQQLLNHDK